MKNLLGIIDAEEAFTVENMLLAKLYEHIFEPEFRLESLDFKAIQNWHRLWLGSVYSWAGQVRTVDMSKDNFLFAAARFLDQQIPPFEKQYLTQLESTRQFTNSQLVHFLAEMHVEFILIHPFREGNGRLSRLLMDIFITYAGFEPLDYSLWFQNKDYYFSAIQAGVAGDYSHMERLINDVLLKGER